MTGRVFLVLAVILVLAACDHSAVKDETSEFYAIPVGSTLELNRDITIPPDQVSVLLQDGAVQQKANINFYRPNCKFELYPISENARLVRPDRFLITKVFDENEFTGLHRSYYASQRMVSTDAPETITYATVMHLHSDMQPDVYRMTCKHWESVVDNRYLTISEMRKAMGDIFTLKINY